MFDLSPATYEILQGPNSAILFACDAILYASGRSTMCSGIDPDKKTAYAKMLSEAAERVAYFASRAEQVPPSSSTGFAAHLTPEAAAIAAQHELIERSFVDRLRRSPQLLRPDYATDTTWRYWIREHDCWFCLARARATKTTGWGCAVDTEADRAEESALREGLLMASSFQTYGRRGNSITALPGGTERLGRRIELRHLPDVIVHSERRYVCFATWDKV